MLLSLQLTSVLLGVPCSPQPASPHAVRPLEEQVEHAPLSLNENSPTSDGRLKSVLQEWRVRQNGFFSISCHVLRCGWTDHGKAALGVSVLRIYLSHRMKAKVREAIRALTLVPTGRQNATTSTAYCLNDVLTLQLRKRWTLMPRENPWQSKLSPDPYINVLNTTSTRIRQLFQ